MLLNFTRRNKLDYEPCELRYKYVPAAFRYDLLNCFTKNWKKATIPFIVSTPCTGTYPSRSTKTT